MNESAHDHDTASTGQKPWIDPVLEEYDVEAVTEAFDSLGPDFGIFS
jgi:hypothetical protein